MGFQGPNLNFVQHGTPISDAASLFLASAQAAARQRADEQRMQEEARHNRAVEEREKKRVDTEEARFKEGHEQAKRQRAEGQEEKLYQARQDYLAISDPRSPKYDPAAAALAEERYGWKTTDEEAQLPAKPELSPAVGQRRQEIARMTALEQQQRAGGPDPSADPDAAAVFEAPISGELGKARGALEADEAGYQKQVADWEATPRTTGRKVVTDREGRSFTYDPKAREGAVQKERDRVADGLVSFAQSPMIESLVMKQAAVNTSELVRRGVVSPQEASVWMKDMVREGNDVMAAGIRAKTQMALAKVRKGVGGSGKAGGDSSPADLKKQLDVEGKYDQVVQKVLQNKGYKDINTQVVKFSDMAATIAGASDSAALAAIGSGQFVKMSQGGVGVISDSDMKVFWSRIGGIGMKAAEAWRGFVDGTLSPEKRKLVEAAVRELESKARSNVNEIGSAIETRLSGVPGGAERVPTYLKTYAPGYAQQREGKRARGGEKDAIKAMDAEADEWLKSMKRR